MLDIWLGSFNIIMIIILLNSTNKFNAIPNTILTLFFFGGN